MEMARREGEERWGLRHWGSLGRENRGGGGGGGWRWLKLVPEIETANSGSKGGRAERLKDLTAWINGDELEIVVMSGGKNDTGDMCSFSNSSGEAD